MHTRETKSLGGNYDQQQIKKRGSKVDDLVIHFITTQVLNSHVIVFCISVGPPSPTSKIPHGLKLTCPNSIGRSWIGPQKGQRDSFTREPPCLQQRILGVPVCIKPSLTSVCLEKTRHARFLRYVYACTIKTEMPIPGKN